MILHLKSGERPSGNLLEDLQNLVQFDFKEAQTQILQATSCGDCVKESSYVSKQQEDKRKSYSLIKSNFTIH